MKITKYYIDRAYYKAVDENGVSYLLSVDYWNNSFKLSRKNKILSNFAKKLLIKKHKVNLVDKVIQ